MKTFDFKILQIIDTLDVGGAEKVFVDISNLLYENHHNVTAFFILKKGKLAKDLNEKIEIIELFRASKFSIKSMSICANFLTKFDILHCHSWHVYRYIKLVCFLFRIKSQIVLQDHYGKLDSKSIERLIFRTILKPKFYIGVSSNSLVWIKNFIKINKNNVFLLQNMVQKYQNKELIQQNKVKGIVLVSNIKPIKNQFFAAQLSKKIEAPLTLIGVIQDQNYYQSVLLENSKLKLISNCTNVPEILDEFKLGLHCSENETGPLVLIEYLAQNLPFLSYETGEISKILKPHFPEYFINNFEIEGWKKRIDYLLNSEPDIIKMNFIFDKYFNSEDYFKQLITIYSCIKN